jgi:PAS domain-containing protein
MTDLKLAVRINPEDGYEWANILLARARFDGTLELLTQAWERLLGYGRRELEGKALRSLMATERGPEAGEGTRAIAAIFDQRTLASVDLTLRCRGGARKRLTLHRRLVAATGTVYIVAERRACAAARDWPSVFGSAHTGRAATPSIGGSKEPR